MTGSMSMIADPVNIRIAGYGITIEGGHTVNDDKYKPNGVEEHNFVKNLTFTYPDTQDELRSKKPVEIKGLPLMVIESAKKATGVGKTQKAKTTISTYEETTDPKQLTRAKKFVGELHFRKAAGDVGIIAELAGTATVDVFDQDGTALGSSNIDPVACTVTS